MSSAEENEPRRRSPQRSNRARPARPRTTTSPKPTRFTLVREQRQPAGEFRQYIQGAQSESSDFMTADESPSDGVQEAAGPRQDSGGAPAIMHDTASAIQGRQQRNQRPRVTAAGDESPHSDSDPDVSFPNYPRVTRQQARQLNCKSPLKVSLQGPDRGNETASTAALLRSSICQLAFLPSADVLLQEDRPQ